LWDYPRSGRPAVVDEAAVIVATVEAPPPESGLTHWSSRELAKRINVSHNEVASIWRTWGLQPHRVESFKFSTDPELEAKIADVVGLYLDPPQNAVVLCVDEKPQVQALERAQPVLPAVPGVPERRSHDYYRHGVSSLFAALEIATGKVVGECYQRHTNDEFLAFLKLVASEYPEDELHLVVDNYGTHTHPNVKAWLTEPANQRITLHFTPTGCSWLNLVEVFFSIITRQALRRGSVTSVDELVTAIENFIGNYNQDCKPFVWTKPADVIVTKATSKRRTVFMKK
jgi:transposase